MTGWRIPAWVPMGNHYHLMLKTQEANLVEGVKWLQKRGNRNLSKDFKKCLEESKILA